MFITIIKKLQSQISYYNALNTQFWGKDTKHLDIN
jgi:hypothetical protein